MPWVILLILAVLALLILAGPPLERIIDRIWPPDGVRPAGTRSPARTAVTTMRAWRVVAPGPDVSTAMEQVFTPVPQPGPVRFSSRWTPAGCAAPICMSCRVICRCTLPSVVPGHEVVGHVVVAGTGVTERQPGDRVGVAWLRDTCGECRYCRRGAENLCPRSRYTGWDADGGYAGYVTVRADFTYDLPAGYSDTELAPLLCAGIIGFRALRRAELPPGGRLGIYGFGASAHLTAQVAMAEGARVHVLTRAPQAAEAGAGAGRRLRGRRLRPPPEPLDAAILFAPVGDLVPVALEALDRGGTLAVAGIHLSDIPALDYQRHLFQERTLRSVTSNTRADGRALLDFAARHPADGVRDAVPDGSGRSSRWPISPRTGWSAPRCWSPEPGPAVPRRAPASGHAEVVAGANLPPPRVFCQTRCTAAPAAAATVSPHRRARSRSPSASGPGVPRDVEALGRDEHPAAEPAQPAIRLVPRRADQRLVHLGVERRRRDTGQLRRSSPATPADRRPRRPRAARPVGRRSGGSTAGSCRRRASVHPPR